jgi:hypothetical protein
MTRITAPAVASALLLPSAAIAHQGDHSGFTADGLLAHLLEPDHLVFLALLLLLGVVALRMARRAKERSKL